MILQANKNELRAASVAHILTLVGILEAPLWSNRGPVIDQANIFVGNSPADEPAYCCALGCYNANIACVEVGIHFADTLLLKTGYCPDEYTHAKGLGQAIDAQAVVAGSQLVQPGDLMLEWIARLGGYHHAETVVSPPSKGQPAFVTVGGNTVPDGYHAPPGHDGQGFGVFKRHRTATDLSPGGHNLYCFVRLI